jgi:hypothetical protein
MRQLTRGMLAALFAFALCARLTPAAVGAGDPAAHLTIYDAGVAEFHEERNIELQPGLNQIEWRSLMPKAYVRTVRVTCEGAEVVRQDVTYDGAEVRNEHTPVLHIALRAQAAGARRVQVDYLAPGLSWQNDYALVLEQTQPGAPPTAALLDSWVSVANSTGADVSAGTVDLIAGEIALRLEGVPRGDYDRAYAQTAQMNAYAESSEAPPPSISAEVSGLSAFSRFRLGRDLTFNANAPLGRLPLFQRARIAITQRNVFENDYGTQTLARGGFTLLPRGLEVRLVAKNTTAATMPAGLVTIYARDGELVQVVGQDRIPLVAPDNEFSVSQGRSATLFGTRRVIEHRQVEYRDERGNTRSKLITSVEVVITNRGALAAEAFVRESIESFADNQWTILTSSVQGERLGAGAIQFKLQVPAGGKTTLTYTVETK